MMPDAVSFGRPCCACAGGGSLCTSRVSLFSGLSREEQLSLVRTARHLDYRKGERIFSQQDPADCVLVVRFGRVKLVRTGLEGREILLDVLNPGDALGEHTLFSDETYGADGIAVDETGVCRISAASVSALLPNSPELARGLLRSMGRKLSDARQMSEILSRPQAAARLAGFLLYRAHRTGDRRVRLSQEEIAAFLNLRRETVSRKLASLGEAGAVRMAGYRDVEVRDAARLLEIFTGQGKPAV